MWIAMPSAPGATPRDCQIFCTLPRSIEEFRGDISRGPSTRLAPAHMRRVAGSGLFDVREAWRVLEDGHIGLLASGLARAAARGAQVESGVAFERFAPDAGKRAIVLIAHTCGEQIEFRDGFHSAEEVARRFPTDFDGSIDLSMCRSFPLHDALRRRLGVDPRIVTSDELSTVGTRIAICVVALELMHQRPVAYDEAVAEVIAMRIARMEEDR